MSRYRSPHHHNTGCWKKAYAKKAHAVDVAREMRRKHGDERLHAYKCSRCGRYHVGHDKFKKNSPV